MARGKNADDLDGLPKPGELLAGKYRIKEVLGHGGMGVVFDGQHEALEQPVAIKFLRPEHTKNEDSLRRFVREARAAARIRSVHATRIFDIDATPSGAPYIVMERLDGESVDRALEARGPFPIPTAVDCILQACEALAEAHGEGLVHRDLKPSNLFLSRQPPDGLCVKVLDFGISKLLSSDDVKRESSLTAPNTLLGSPQYMAPEQVRSQPVDARTDIWALGVLLYELLTQQSPFQADSIPHLYVLILSAAPTPLRARLPRAPAKLEEAILRCLEKDPAKRPENVYALALLLQPFGSMGAAESVARIRGAIEHGTPSSNRGAAPRPSRTPSAARPTVDLALAPTQAAMARAPWRRWAFAVVAVIGVAVVLARVPRRLRSDPPSPPAAVAPLPPAPAAELAKGPPPPLPAVPDAPATASAAAAPSAAPDAAPPRATAPDSTRVHDLRSIKLLP